MYICLTSGSIEKAFGSGPDCLGIIVVKDLPSTYSASRERLLKLAYKFAKLPENVREQYADTKSRYRYVPCFYNIMSIKMTYYVKASDGLTER